MYEFYDETCHLSKTVENEFCASDLSDIHLKPTILIYIKSVLGLELNFDINYEKLLLYVIWMTGRNGLQISEILTNTRGDA